MKPDYITLSDGRKVRVEWNMNALADWSEVTGLEITDLVDEKVNIPILRTIAWCAAKEGEAADEKTLELDEIHFGRLMNMPCIMEFSKILTSQTGGMAQKKNKAPTRLPRIFFRQR